MRGYKDEVDMQSHQKTISVLLKAGANPNACNSKTEMSCLHWAAYYPEDELPVTGLIEAGARISVSDVKGLTSLDIAGIRGGKKTPTVLDYLLKRAETEIEAKWAVETTHEGKPLIIPIEDQADYTVTVKADLEGYSDEKKRGVNPLPALRHGFVRFWAPPGDGCLMCHPLRAG